MKDMEATVVLVDETGSPVGTSEKLAAHLSGQLHLAFSVFIFNTQGQLLLQQRAFDKYHSAGLWTNTCCSHPYPGEAVADAAIRRLREEMGFEAPLREAFAFTYRAELDRGLTEHEFDHVFTGTFEGSVHPNPEEVAAYRWVSREEVEADLVERPDVYTEWFKIVCSRVWDHHLGSK
jgi:isopentenyl-diphosphate delta-isomerase